MVRSPIVKSTLDAGELLQEIGHDGCHELNDVGGGVDPQRTARRRLKSAGDVVGLFEIGEYLGAAIVIGLADFGEADLACGAVEKPRAEPLFQCLDVVAHHRRRHVEAPAGR
jgi:hypothetical protein